jgi:hypothetical protein
VKNKKNTDFRNQKKFISYYLGSITTLVWFSHNSGSWLGELFTDDGSNNCWVLSGFLAYISTAAQTTATAIIVFQCNGKPNRIKLKMAVNTSSKAEANAFRMEFKFFKNKEVTIPTIELLIIIQMTKNCQIVARETGVKLETNSCL